MDRPPAFLLLLFCARVAVAGEMSQTNALFQSLLLDEQSPKSVGSQSLSPSVREEIWKASPDEIHQFIPLIRQCLESKSGALHSTATMFLAAVALRPDGANTLDPFIEPLSAVLGDGADQDLKRGAISVIAASVPKPSPKGLAFLAVRLNDADTTGEQLLRIGGALIRAYPDNSVLVRAVIDGFRSRPRDRFEAGRMMELLGLLRITSEEALAFIDDGLDDTQTRQSAIESVGRMPQEARARFLPKLQRIAEDPNESADTRSRAQYALLEH